MHGVGNPMAKRAFEMFSLNDFIVTKEQKDPDPDFPTVAFPNPEEGKSRFNNCLSDRVFYIYFLF